MFIVLVIINITSFGISLILSRTMHLPFLTPSNKNPYFHSINVNPDSLLILFLFRGR